MKKTYNINIAGFGFVIDEDAYETLDSYLSTLQEICIKAGEGETAQDIEQRIAEIFSEDLNASSRRIITLEDVETVIMRMGAPEEIIELGAADVSKQQAVEETVTPQATAFKMPGRKRLYRDIDDRVLGGVCAGIGWYFNIDPVWVRVIAVACAFLSASTIAVVYIILWIVVPPAKKPIQQMQMMGMDPSMQNVGMIVTGGYTKNRDVATGIGRILLVVMSGLGLLIVGGILLALSVAFIGCLVGIVVPVGFTDPRMVEARLVMGLVMGGAILIGLPLFYLFRSLLGLLMGRSLAPLNPVQSRCMLFSWLASLACVITCSCLL